MISLGGIGLHFNHEILDRSHPQDTKYYTIFQPINDTVSKLYDKRH